ARLANDLVEFRDGHSIEGDVQVIDGGRTVAIRVALPAGIAEGARPLMKYPMSDVDRIRRRGELVEARRVYTEELGKEIDQALEKLGADDPKAIEEARKFLVDCGVFAIHAVRKLHEELASTEPADSPRQRALRSILHVWEIKRLIPDEVQEFAPDVYEILALEAEPHEKREFLKWVLPPYPEETKDLALYLVKCRDEDLSVRAFA